MLPLRQAAHPDELLSAIDRLQQIVSHVHRDAGSCMTPEHDRLLQSLTRGMRTLGGEDAYALAIDVRDAAMRALEASEPEAPLLVLDLTSRSLQQLLQRLLASSNTAQAA